MHFFPTAAFLLSAVSPATDEVAKQPFYETAAFINSAIFIGLILASGFIGHWLAKGLRVAEYGFKFGVILFALLASAVVVVRGWPPRLGYDLGGGSILVYKVDENMRNWRPEEMMDSLLTAISNRINPGGQKEMSVRSLGTNMVQIVMPTVTGSSEKEKEAEKQKVKDLIATTGALQFRIEATTRDDPTLIEKARAERAKYPARLEKPLVVTERGKKAEWIRVRDQEVDSVKFNYDEDTGTRQPNEAAMMVGTVKDKDKTGKEIDKELWEVLVLDPESPAYDVTGRDIRDARAGHNPKDNSPEVEFSFNSAGGVKFGRLTGEHMIPGSTFRYHLAIVMDNELQTAPTLQAAITDNGVITGKFTEEKVKEYVDIINAGSLPAALETTPVRDNTIDPTLGKETIKQSLYAMLIASIVVPLFMIFYYRFAGLVAVLVLSLNMLMLVALMILIKAPFTLPALAGLALTVGMAVDNNVLIYERLREEISHGAALRMAIRNSFHRVGVVIIDANITHLIAATVLWSVGTEQIKGFAVTFWLGAVLSIWATMFVARVMFEVTERRRWIHRLNMMQWIGHTKIDFMAWFPACATFSVVITVLGLVIAVVRGQGLFDIDFTGGVSVQAAFRQEQKIEDIRKAVDVHKDVLPDATVTNTHQEDEPENHRVIIDTSNSNREQVEAMLKELFDNELVTLGLSATVVEPEKPAPKPVEKKDFGNFVPPISFQGMEKSATVPGTKSGELPAEKSAPKPADTSKPAETSKPADSTKPAETMKPAETSKPAETTKPAETSKPADTTKPAETSKPADTTKPADTMPGENKPLEAKPRQSRSDLPALSLVAMAGPEAVLLAQAEPAPAKTSAESKADEKGSAKAEPLKADAKAEPAKADAKSEPLKADAKAEPAKLETKSEPPKADAKTPPKADADAKTEKPAGKISPENLPLPLIKADTAAVAPATEPMFQAKLELSSTVAKWVEEKEGDQVKRTVQEVPVPVRYDATRLQAAVEAALKEYEIDPKLLRIELTNPDGLTTSDHWDLKLSPNSEKPVGLTPARFKQVLKTLESKVSGLAYFPIEDNIGSAVASDTQFWAVVALVSSWSLIIIYLWIRFQGVAFGVAAVVALIHDVLVMLGAIAFSSYLARIPGLTTVTLIEPFKINLPIVAAFLTIIGYSVNDTIVVFDRIREIRGKSPTLTRQMVNDATNQTLSRTLLTSLTVMMVVVILYIFGGVAVHGFAFALIIGVLTGTYSSIYVAAPILLWMLHPKEMSAETASGKPEEPAENQPRRR
jgi:SecD/SecF fusion protein